MLDSLIGILILSIAASALYGLLPVVRRSQVLAAQKTHAAAIASRMVEELQQLKPSTLTTANLHALSLVDGTSNGSPYTFTNSGIDSGTAYCPSKALPKGTGTLTLTNLAGNSVMAQITVTWAGADRTLTYTTATVLGGYR